MAAMVENNVTAMSDDVPVANGVRRSARSRKAPLKYDEEYIIPSENHCQSKPTAGAERPKRRAAEAAREQIVPEDAASLQGELFTRMDIDERKEYRGWVELESEPAFFNAMLQDLDAKSLKVQEVFALDDLALADLPKPVYGLILLYEWTDEDESNEARQDCPEDLWFANQTTAHACATVALMNIIMNTHTGKFGIELEEFRNMTRLLPPPHRGHALDTNNFIRAIHNSVARRSDLLSEDLLLDNKYESASRVKKAPPKKKAKTSRSSKPDYEEGTYHYIAFVPVDGQVWELDGLESKPLSLGHYVGDNWLEVASETIQRRMARQNNKFLSFNLLAICEPPLLTISRDLATSLATAKALDDVVTGSPSWDVPTPWESFPDTRLTRFNLTREQILSQFSPHPSFDARVSDPCFDIVAAQKYAHELGAQQEALEAQYVNEVATVDETVEMIRARRHDYTPAVHQWVRLLSEKGILRQFVQEMDSLG
ncbi:ubiquitin carboxyl-terminal hydrolase [Xylaria arbuscula]|nr:ubiquitin carboxyl-terminal hydrolase [Xylaria arbuscula]